jgi:hypothetical protein
MAGLHARRVQLREHWQQVVMWTVIAVLLAGITWGFISVWVPVVIAGVIFVATLVAVARGRLRW